MVIDAQTVEGRKREVGQGGNGGVGVHRPGRNLTQQPAQSRLVHDQTLVGSSTIAARANVSPPNPCPVTGPGAPILTIVNSQTTGDHPTGAPSPQTPAAGARPGAHGRIGYLGPAGTFTEQALFTQADLCTAELVPMASIPEILAATTDGTIDAGFVPIENAIEGTVTDTQDGLVHTHDLLVQREVVIPVSLHLLVVPGASIQDITTVVSYPHALGQCRSFLDSHIPGVSLEATHSTADAAQLLATSGDRSMAAIATSRAAELYGLDILAPEIEDHPDNATRFLLVARHTVPAPTGYDKTSLVVFQHADTPGSLLDMLLEFSIREVNLTKLESRPTRRGLGDYCFLVDLEGHIHDGVVADAVRSLKAKQADVKFLGSYPAAGDTGPERRAARDAAHQAASVWMDDLQSRIEQ
jgi:prephenate dehydratase